MNRIALRLLIIVLGIVTSYGIWFGSAITSFILGSRVVGGNAPTEVFMPSLTRYAVDQYWVMIVITCLFSFAGLILSVRRSSDALTGAIGVAMPLLTGWFMLFALSYDLFLGPVSLHHAQRFDLAAVVFRLGGFYSVTFALIMYLLVVLAREAVRHARGK